MILNFLFIALVAECMLKLTDFLIAFAAQNRLSLCSRRDLMWVNVNLLEALAIVFSGKTLFISMAFVIEIGNVFVSIEQFKNLVIKIHCESECHNSTTHPW